MVHWLLKMKLIKFSNLSPHKQGLGFTGWSCTRMSMDIRVHIGRNPRSQLKNKQERDRGPTTHRGWDSRNDCPSLWISWQRRTQSSQRRICLDHELVRDQNKCVLCGDCVRACHEIQSIEQLISRGRISQQGALLYDYSFFRIVIMGPACPGPWGPGTGGSQITISLKPT